MKNFKFESESATLMVSPSVEWALSHGLAFKSSEAMARHCPFTLSPCVIDKQDYLALQQVSEIFARWVYHLGENVVFLQKSMAILGQSDPLFKALISLYSNQQTFLSRKVTPLLLMRSDFMEDDQTGFGLIEFNGIAAGMAPFGQRLFELHRYLSDQYDPAFQSNTLVKNTGLTRLAEICAAACCHIKNQYTEEDKPTFLMVIQPNEDNVYDQHLLEFALQGMGIRTLRKTWQELSLISTENNNRLFVDGIPVDMVYLRSGYQIEDYADGKEVDCNLFYFRFWLEQQNIVMNATIGQQLASSKFMQQWLSAASVVDLESLGFIHKDIQKVQPYLTKMYPINEIDPSVSPKDWVLKNQGEGGGHCYFDDELVHKWQSITQKDEKAWALMHRIHPKLKPNLTWVVRNGIGASMTNIMSEVGIFSAYAPFLNMKNGDYGYLVRSKSIKDKECGVHSGQGLLDSLMFLNDDC
jgi:glutathione synthase